MKDILIVKWISRVIESCETRDQLNTSHKLITLYFKRPSKSLNKQVNVSSLISIYKLKKELL